MMHMSMYTAEQTNHKCITLTVARAFVGKQLRRHNSCYERAFVHFQFRLLNGLEKLGHDLTIIWRIYQSLAANIIIKAKTTLLQGCNNLVTTLLQPIVVAACMVALRGHIR